MKIKTAIVLALLAPGMWGCVIERTTNVFDASDDHSVGNNPTGPGAGPCDALVAGVELRAGNGLQEGGVGLIGEPVHFSVRAVEPGGAEISEQCRNEPVSARSSGPCSVLGTPVYTDVALLPGPAPGVCAVTVTYLERTAATSFQVVNP